MIRQERHGQLVIGRILWPFGPEEVARMLEVQKRLQATHPEPSVVCIDTRAAGVLPREVADGLIVALGTKKVRRIAVLVAQQFIAELQIQRVMKTAGQDKGQLFKDAEAAKSWLAQLLTAEEQKILSDFLAEETAT